MTRRIFSSLGTFTLLGCLAASMTAAAEGHKVRVHVPFDFQMNGAAMPAGQYHFETPANGAMIYLTAPDGGRHAAITMPLGNPGYPKAPQVVFEKLGDRYRLSEVWVSGATTGGGLPRTKAEKEYARQFGKGSTVALALKTK